jgi:hypothetical protein
MITRSINGMLALLPGATPMTPTDSTKRNVGSVSYAWASGTSMSATLDCADNRDNRQGATLMNFTLESLEQFQLATSQFSAADGKTGDVAVSMITKSGTNLFHGSGFLYARLLRCQLSASVRRPDLQSRPDRGRQGAPTSKRARQRVIGSQRAEAHQLSSCLLALEADRPRSTRLAA